MAQSAMPPLSNASPEEIPKDEDPLFDLGYHFEKIRMAQKLLCEVYDDIDIFITVDPNTIVSQNGKVTPYLQTPDHIANINSQLEDIRLDIESIANDMATTQPPPDPLTYIHSLSQDSRDLLRQPAPYIAPNVPVSRPKTQKKKKH